MYILHRCVSNSL